MILKSFMKKGLLIFFLGSIVLIAGYCFLSSREKKIHRCARLALKNCSLCSLNHQDRVYFEIVHDTLVEQQPLPSLSTKRCSRKLKDAYAILAVLAYCNQNQPSLAIEHFKALSSKTPRPVLYLLKGLIFLAQNDPSQALSYLSQIQSFDLDTDNPYLAWLPSYASRSFLFKQQAVCSYAIDDFEKATALLNQQITESIEPSEDCLELKTLSLLRQTESLILLDREPLYQQVIPLLKTVKKSCLAVEIHKHALQLWENQTLPHILTPFLEFIFDLYDSNRVINFTKQLFTFSLSVTHYWVSQFQNQNSCFIPHMIHYLDQEMKEAIVQCDFTTYAKSLQLFFTLCQNSEELLKSGETIFRSHLLRQIAFDDSSLTQTRQLLHVCSNFLSFEHKKEELSSTLFYQGSLFWQKAGGESKGTALIQLGSEITAHQKAYLKQAELFFKDLFAASERSNTLDRLSLIYDACFTLEIPLSISVCPDKIAHLIADAQYYFSQFDYIEAKNYSGWILKMLPSHQEALKMYGLSCYYLGQSHEAISSLAKIQHPDTQVMKTLMMTKSLPNQEERLVQTDYIEVLEEDL